MSSRVYLTALVSILLPWAAAAAQQACDSRGGYDCDHRGPSQSHGQCACGRPCIDKHVYLPAPCEQPSQPEAGSIPEGGFAAPPRTGTVAGETRALGLEGLSIEIPAIRLRLPNIRFPSLTQYRTNPRMIIDEAAAPFVNEFRNESSFESAPLERPAPEAGPARRPEPSVPEGGVPRQPCDSRHCAECAARNGYYSQAYNQPPAQVGGYIAPQPVGYSNGYAPPMNSQGYVDPFEDRIRHLHATEQRIDAKLMQLQDSIERLAQLQQNMKSMPSTPSPSQSIQQATYTGDVNQQGLARLHAPIGTPALAPFQADGQVVRLAPPTFVPATPPSRLPNTGG